MFKNALLFVSTLLCWSPTWYIIKFQLGYVDPLISVFYRIGLACIIIFIVLIITNQKLKFKLSDHAWFLALGLCLFLQITFFFI